MSSKDGSRKPIVLSVDTSTREGGVAIFAGTEHVAHVDLEKSLSNSVTLLKAVDDCLKKSGIELEQIDLFAVAAGPGSFTGLRIGIATVKAFAATFEKGCIGVPTLHAVAHRAGQSTKTLALLEAGRGEVFAQILSCDKDGVIAELTRAVHLSPAHLLEEIDQIESLTIAGNGAILLKNVYAVNSQLLPGLNDDVYSGADGRKTGWNFLESNSSLAADIAAIGYNDFQRGKVLQAEALDPIYVRPSDPELKTLCLAVNRF